MKFKTVILKYGRLKSGEEICSDCWRAVLRDEPDKGPDLGRLTLEEVIYRLSSFKKSVHQKALEAQEPAEPTTEPAPPDEYALESPAQAEEASSQTIEIPEEPVPVADHASRVQALLAEIGITPASYPALWQVKDLENELLAVLGDGERLVAAVKGSYGKEPVALIATTQKLILTGKEAFGGSPTEVYNLSWILSIDHRAFGSLSDLAFALSSVVLTLQDVETERARLFCGRVQDLLPKA